MRVVVYYFLFFVGLYHLSSTAFSSVIFDTYPEGWIGDTTLFVKNSVEGTLQLNAPEEAGEAFLFYPSESLEDAEWEIGVSLDFNPSSNNYMKIYLATDGADSFENGFYLVIGTSKDNISLWERSNGEDRLLIEGTEKLLDMSSVDLTVRVSRTKGGDWTMEANIGDGWLAQGETFSSFGFRALWFGLSCHYTKTRSDKFVVRQIVVNGEPFNRLLPLQITSLQVINGHNLLIEFSDKVSQFASTPQIYGVGFELPKVEDVFYEQDSSSVKVALTEMLPDKEEGQLIISGWCNNGGLCMEDTILSFSYISPKVTNFFVESYFDLFISFNQILPSGLLQSHHFNFKDADIQVEEVVDLGKGDYHLRLNHPIKDAVEVICFIEELELSNGDVIPSGPYSLYYHEASPFDLVFSEIMHDPIPSVLLPEVEYIELYNRSELPVNLKNMILSVNGKRVVLDAYMLYPGEYVVLSQSDEFYFPGLVVPDKWNALTNSGGELALFSPSGKVVAAFRYPETLEGKEFKQKGGWSMEVIDPDNLSGDIFNWAYSDNEKGGTPGEPNSVAGFNPDMTSPSLEDAWLVGDTVLMLKFSEQLDSSSFKVSDFHLLSSSSTIAGIVLDSVYFEEVKIEFKNRLIPHKVEELVIPSEITDLAGNKYSGLSSLFFGLPGSIDSLDIVINELLFDPPVDGSDYVELYNRSDHIAALNSICLARNGDGDGPEELIPLSDRLRWFLPGRHLCFTEDATWVKSNFFCENEDYLIDLYNFPNFLADGGTVFLTQLNGEVIDRFDYSPKMHFELLTETKGVALERIAYDVDTNRGESWHSASSITGYGTPTAINSQFVSDARKATKQLFQISPEIFTPDMDGMDDLLVISYSVESPVTKGTFIIFDAEGRQVKLLVNNRTLSTSGRITWDGISDDHSLASPGIYIVWCKIYDLSGNVREYKDSFVLGTSSK
ncbi:lamin tail domain-containing protein [Thermophagus sp. OGC60D27]|uniref:lamin tail domain-containing protein n=1 Tax=Thermophagus sp. OGC60D27 TaxID=3458415 RepID=UPI00403803F6